MSDKLKDQIKIGIDKNYHDLAYGEREGMKSLGVEFNGNDYWIDFQHTMFGWVGQILHFSNTVETITEFRSEQDFVQKVAKVIREHSKQN